MLRRTPGATCTDTLFLYTALFRSGRLHSARGRGGCRCGEPLCQACSPEAAATDGVAVEGVRHKRGRPNFLVVSAEALSIFSPSARAGRSEEHTSELQSLMRI